MADREIPDQSAEIFDDIDHIVLQVKRVTVKDAVNSEAEWMLGRRGDPQGVKNGRRVYIVQYNGDEIEIPIQRVRLEDGSVPMPELLRKLRGAKKTELVEMVGRHRSLRRASKEAAGRRGVSPANLQRNKARDRQEKLEEVMSRRFVDGRQQVPARGKEPQPKPIVAVSMDGVAIGEKHAQRNVLVAIGTDVDGRKWLLAVAEDQFENAKQAERLIRSLVDRGISDRVLWITDGGAGMTAGIEEVCEAAPLRQRCTKHVMDNVLGDWLTERHKAPKEIRDQVRDLMRDAWDKSPNADVALEKLQAVAALLDERGYSGAAESLRGSMGETVTVMRLGLPAETQRKLRTTNKVESANAGLRAEITRKNWKSATPENQQREAWVATVLLDQEPNWEPLVEDTSGLRRLYEERITRDRPSGLRRSPHLVIDRVGVDTTSQGAALDHAVGLFSRSNLTVTPAARELQSKRLRRSRQPRGSGQVQEPVESSQLEAQPEPSTPARWLGSEDALVKLGLSREAEVTGAALVSALTARNTDTGKMVRSPTTVTFGLIGDKDDPTAEKGTGLLQFRFRLTAPRELSDAWRGASPAMRAEIEQLMLAGAQASLERIGQGEFSSRRKNASPVQIQGVAAVGSVRAEHEVGSRMGKLATVTGLKVEGFILGALDQKGKLLSPGNLYRDRPRRRLGEQAAKTIIDQSQLIVEQVRSQQAAERQAEEVAGGNAQARTRGPRARQDPLPGVDRRPPEYWAARLETGSAETAIRPREDAEAARSSRPRDSAQVPNGVDPAQELDPVRSETPEPAVTNTQNGASAQQVRSAPPKGLDRVAQEDRVSTGGARSMEASEGRGTEPTSAGPNWASSANLGVVRRPDERQSRAPGAQEGDRRYSHRARSRQRASEREAVIKAMLSGDLKLRDPLDRFRPHLGPARAKRIADGAHAHTQTERYADRDEGWLWEKVRETKVPFAELDEEAAREVLEIEALRDARDGIAHSASSRGGDAVRQLHQHLDESLSADARAMRSPGGFEEATAKQALARRALMVDPVELDKKEEALRRSRRHPDQWEEDFGDAAAQWLAARRELEICRERAKLRARATDEIRLEEPQRPPHEIPPRTLGVEAAGPGLGM